MGMMHLSAGARLPTPGYYLFISPFTHSQVERMHPNLRRTCIAVSIAQHDLVQDTEEVDGKREVAQFGLARAYSLP
jgi:hypothetical protein